MEFEKFITKALKLGFAGKVEPEKISRMGFTMKRVHYNELDGQAAGSRYHDEWTDSRLGGGQELTRLVATDKNLGGESEWTRLYAGGVIVDEELEKLGITVRDVMRYLKKEIDEQGEKTRLFADCEPQLEDNWRYAYKIVEKIPEIELTVAKESIEYKSSLVFVHYFLISPIK